MEALHDDLNLMLIGKDHRLETEHFFQFFFGELRDPLTRIKNKGMSARRARRLFGHQTGAWGQAGEIGVGLLAYGSRRALREVSALPDKPCDLIAVVVTQYGAAGGKLPGRPPRIGNQCGVLAGGLGNRSKNHGQHGRAGRLAHPIPSP